MMYSFWRCSGLPACTLVFLAGLASAAGAAEQDPAVEEIVERTNRVAYYQGADGRARVKMSIKDSQGRERQRQFTILRRDGSDPAGAEGSGDSYCGDQEF